MIHSYPSIYQVGSTMINALFAGEVLIEEKVDGSQFSFGIVDGRLECRSRKTQIDLEAPGMFGKAVQTVKEISPLLVPEWIYRCEYLATPRHNVIAYNRVPNHYLVLFDVLVGEEAYLNYHMKKEVADYIGLECVPAFYWGDMATPASLEQFLGRESFLGGAEIEGVVVKNYGVITKDKKIAIGKFVSSKFKETMQGKSPRPKEDFVQAMIDKYKTEARWQKAVQHLSEDGRLQHEAKDIGALVAEISQDVETEHKQEIMQALYDHYWPQVKRGIISGMPEWYKSKLVTEIENG